MTILWKRYYLLVLMVLLQTLSYANDNGCVQRNYSGKIGDKWNVKFHLKNSNGHLAGFYYYDKIGVDIKIVGNQKDDVLNLYELNDKNDTVALIKGTVSDLVINGVWVSTTNKKSYSLILSEINNTITPLSQSVVGQYVDSICNLKLIISKVKGEYSYKFVSTQRTLTGKVTFSRGSENYLVLEGIEYAEDYFDVALPEENELSRHYEELQKEGKRSVGIACFLSSQELIIQNYGNAMNYYVKLHDCDEKYIYLMKK